MTLHPHPSWYVALRVRNIESGASTRTALCLRELIYMPLVALLALTLAAPKAPKRREWWWSVALGAGLSLLMVACYLLLPIVALLGSDRVRALGLPRWFVGPLGAAIFTAMAETTCAIAIVLWATARWATIRGDWLWLDVQEASDRDLSG
jgi:hypothetical protein